jgi:Domain of unknown function (DUF5671)
MTTTPSPFSYPSDRLSASTPWRPPWQSPASTEVGEPAPPPSPSLSRSPSPSPSQSSSVAGGSPSAARDLAAWLDLQERNVTHPTVVQDQMRRAGWHPIDAMMEAARYRTRFNEHPLGYAALLAATGASALATGTVGHILVGGLDRTINRNSLAWWLTVLAVSLPFAVWAHVWAARVDRHDPVAVWSEPRRLLAKALVWACGIVGIGRLAWYVAHLIGTLLGATWAIGESTGAGALNVAITVSIALPVGLWAFGFLHRFDDENPVAPRRQRRRNGR